MTEKRVSVRLSAVGGRQVKAELELIGDLELGRVDNPFEGAASDAGAQARAAFQAAFTAEPIAVPDLGLGGAAAAARGEAEALRAALSGVVEAATPPLASVAALRDAVAASGMEAERALTGARGAAGELEDTLDATGEAAGRAGGAGRGAGQALKDAA